MIKAKVKEKEETKQNPSASAVAAMMASGSLILDAGSRAFGRCLEAGAPRFEVGVKEKNATKHDK
jgi:hypothetical protein